MNRFIKTAVLTVLLTAAFAIPVFALPSDGVGYIYIGDSRFAYMDQNIAFSAQPNVFNVSVPGEGCWWLYNIATPYVDNLKASNPQIKVWYEIYGLGVNDLASIEYYLSYYRNRALSNNVILVSVNPVENCDRADNAAIEAFNARLAATKLPYIDCYNYLKATSYGTYDGIHFTPETNQHIYNYLDACVTLLSQQR